MSLPALLLAALLFQAPDPAALLEQGRLSEAEQILSASLRAQPDDVRAIVLMGIVLDRQRRYAEAEPYYVRAVSLAPRAPAVLNNAGNHWLEAGKTAEAKAAFLKVVAIQPRHPNANLQLARIAAGEKRGADVLRYLGRLEPAAQSERAVQIVRARALHWAGRQDEAASLLSSLESRAAGDARLDFSVGLVYAEWKRYEDAERAFSRTLQANPTDREVLYNLALAAIGARHYERARDVLEAVLRQKPDDVDALYAIARTWAETGNNEMALIPLVQARKMAPKRADVLEFIGHVSDALGYYGDAAAAYGEYLKIKPDNDIVRRERGFSLVRGNRLEEGVKDIEWYVNRHPNDVAGLFQLSLAESVRDPERALVLLDRALSREPGHLASLFSRGSLLMQLNRPADAVKDLQKVLEQEPENVRALDRIGQAFLYLEDLDAALKTLVRAAELAPADPKVLTHYSQALRAAGRSKEARAVIERFRQIPEETRRVPYGGMLEFLSLPIEQQRARYFERLQRSVKVQPGNPDLQVRLGREMLVRGRTAEAVDAYRTAVRLDPEPARAEQIAKSLLAHELYAPAREILEPLAAKLALDAQLDLAIAIFHTSGPAQGLEALERVPTPDRKGDYYLLRAQILDTMGRFEDAADSLNRGFRAAPTRTDLYVQAAQFLLKHGRFADALDLLDQAVRLLPDVPELRLTHAIALELSRRTEAALKEIAEIQARWPEWERTYVIKGIVLDINKKPAEARQALETAVALGADSAEAWYFLALAITETAPDDISGAEKAIARALELNRDDPYIRGLAGKLAYTRGDLKSAVGHLTEAVRLFPNFVQAHYNLATTWRALGDEEKALAEMKQVRRIREESPDTQTETPPLGHILFGVRR